MSLPPSLNQWIHWTRVKGLGTVYYPMKLCICTYKGKKCYLITPKWWILQAQLSFLTFFLFYLIIYLFLFFWMAICVTLQCMLTGNFAALSLIAQFNMVNFWHLECSLLDCINYISSSIVIEIPVSSAWCVNVFILKKKQNKKKQEKKSTK